MRLLELRLIEDQHSFVRFPGNLTIVAGMSPAARNWFVHAAPLLLEGIACGASAFVEFGGATHEIGAGAFIGSDTALVAPVKVGAGAITAAGSVITENIEADALAIVRAPLVQKRGWAAAFRASRTKDKK